MANFFRQVALAPKSLFVRSASKLVAASIVSHIIILGMMPIVTRIYNPDDFGIFALFTSVMAVTLVGSSLRYELAIPLARSKRDATSVLWLTLLLNCGTAGIVFVAILMVGQNLWVNTEVSDMSGIILILPVFILGAGTYRAFRFWAIRNNNFNGIAYTKILQSVAAVSLQILLGVCGFGAAGLVIGQIAGFSFGTRNLARNVSVFPKKIAAHAIKKRILFAVKKYINFPKYDFPSSIINSASVQFPAIFLFYIFGPSTVGFYLLADKIIGTPVTLVSQSIGQVLYARSSSWSGGESLFRIIIYMCVILGAPGVVTGAFLIFFGEYLFAWIFGAAWSVAGIYASWIVVGYIPQLIYSSISLVLLSTNGQRLSLLINIGLFSTKAIAMFYGMYAGNALITIGALSIANFAAYSVAIGLTVFHVNKI